MESTMRAWQYSAINGKLEDSISIKDIPSPTRGSLRGDEIIVEVIRSSLNPVDYKIPESGAIGRLLISPPATPGFDFCGRVVAKQSSDTTFEEGQLVFGGLTGIRPMGSLGQYMIVPGSCCALLPQGSLMPDKLKAGAKVFINGGSGGVGTWTVQLAKTVGAEDVATCSTDNVQLCHQLGADEVIDYKKVDVIAQLRSRGPISDLIIDNVGGDWGLYNISKELLKPSGTFVQVGVGESMSFLTTFAILSRQIRSAVFGGRGFYFVNANVNTDFLRRIWGWMAEGKAKAVIDSVYAWEEVPAAFTKLRGGHGKGKMVVRVTEHSG